MECYNLITDKQKDLFWEKVEIRESNQECWYWGANTNPSGYGLVSWTIGGIYKSLLAHRLSFFFSTKINPNGFLIRHDCDNRLCVNPNHLSLGTALDNSKDRDKRGRNFNKNKTHCRNGHEFTEENTKYIKDNSRACRICSAFFSKKHYLKTKSLGIKQIRKKIPTNSDQCSILLIDVDGVLTDGKIMVDSKGEKFKSFHSRDNRAISEFIAKGWQVHLVSASSWSGIQNYTAKLGVDVHIRRDKSNLKDIVGDNKYISVADDSWDIDMLARSEKCFCPNNAFLVVKNIPNIVKLETNGGEGVIAELALLLLHEGE